jgi:4-alpha-glucanotransferase
MNDLAATARRWGIEPEYYDGLGRYHTAGPETLTRLIDAISAGIAQPQPSMPPSGADALPAFQGDGRRLWALTVQLYALRSQRNWGHGDFTDLLHLVILAAVRGVSAIGLNPLHMLFPDRAEAASPYSPNSRLFLNPLYVDVESIAEFSAAETAKIAGEIAVLRSTDLVDYKQVARLKLTALHLAHERFRIGANAQRRAEFATYRREQGEVLLRFACFEVLRRQFAPEPWPRWPQEWQSPDIEALESFRSRHKADCEFHEFVQWIADGQLGACQTAARRLGMPIGLYIDLAVGIDPAGADAWMLGNAVLAGVSIGAPPDALNTSGQDWGLASFNPQLLPTQDFAVMRRLMAATMRHAGAIRLDHVLGLQRLFLIPHGESGAYVNFPFDALLGVIAQESHRQQCIVIGEDLGTLPVNFRATMKRWGLWGCRVMLFERERDGQFRPPETYPVEALATFATHDMATLRGWRESFDLMLKRSIGIDPGESDGARAQAQKWLRATLAEYLPSYDSDTVAAVAAFLAATPSCLVAVSLDDVLGVLDQVNIPGTVDQHPNWRRKLPVTLEALAVHPVFARVAQAFQRAGRSFAG